jgi:hypothetical protein
MTLMKYWGLLSMSFLIGPIPFQDSKTTEMVHRRGMAKWEAQERMSGACMGEDDGLSGSIRADSALGDCSPFSVSIFTLCYGLIWFQASITLALFQV